MTILYALAEPENVAHPIALTRVDRVQDSANIVHELLDGGIAITLLGDRPAAGTFELTFDDDAELTKAMAILRLRSRMHLEHDRAAVTTTFVRVGTLRAAVHDEVKHLWILSVGYQEVDE